jgi:hypothetical protein
MRFVRMHRFKLGSIRCDTALRAPCNFTAGKRAHCLQQDGSEWTAPRRHDLDQWRRSCAIRVHTQYTYADANSAGQWVVFMPVLFSATLDCLSIPMMATGRSSG